MRDQWQPIETAPKDGTAVMLYVPQGVDRAGYQEAPEGVECFCLGWFGPEADSFGVGKWVSVDVQVGLFQGSEETGSWTEYEWTVISPTHWSPLPSPPSVKD